MAENGIQALQPVDRETLKSKVSRVLRQAIQLGQLRPNQRLVEEEISRQLGVSRVPVREAIAALEKDGLVVREFGRGARVANPSVKDIDEIYGLRLALELFALRRVFERIEEEHLNSFEELVDEMAAFAKEEDVANLLEVDLIFHETLCKLAGNQRLYDAWRSQVSQVRMLLALSGSMDFDMQNMVHGHYKILEAMRDNDPETARSLLETHICMSRDRLLKHRREESD